MEAPNTTAMTSQYADNTTKGSTEYHSYDQSTCRQYDLKKHQIPHYDQPICRQYNQRKHQVPNGITQYTAMTKKREHNTQKMNSPTRRQAWTAASYTRENTITMQSYLVKNQTTHSLHYFHFHQIFPPQRLTLKINLTLESRTPKNRAPKNKII